MTAPGKANARRAPGAQDVTPNQQQPEHSTARPWRVVVCGVGRGPMVWSTYGSEADAAVAARRLRVLGLDAAVGLAPVSGARYAEGTS